MHSDNRSESTTKNKHEIIEYYNSTKGRVDTMDQITQYYSTKRITHRWPMVIFFKCIKCHNYMVETSKFFSTQENGLPYSACKIGEIPCWHIIRREPIHFENNFIFNYIDAKKRKRCYMCLSKQDQKSNMYCYDCQKSIYGEQCHSVQKLYTIITICCIFCFVFY